MKFALLALLYILVFPALAAEFSVMSFNIRFGTANDGENAWPHRKELVVEAIAHYSPDLLGLQESVDFQVEYLAEALPEYEIYSVPRSPDGGESCAIFFRKARFEKMEEGTFWLSETPEKEASKSWDSSLPRIVSWVRLKDRETGEKLLFSNTHFDHRGQIARKLSAQLIRKRIPKLAGDTPFVITGDFNCTDGSEPQKALTGDDDLIVDTFRSLNPEIVPEDEGTFTGFKDTDNGRRIDWVLCSSSLKVESAEIGRFRKEGRVPSDHYPVTAVLKFAK